MTQSQKYKTYRLASGYQMPALGLGTWKAKGGEVYKAVKHALEVGYKHIDCASVYGNEKEVGQALKEAFEQNIVNREDLFITSKLWNDSHKQEQVIPALQKTLGNLGLDYLDLYLIHWPVAANAKGDLVPLSEVPLSETWHGMEGAKEEGLVRSLGVSNFNLKKIEEVLKIAKLPISINQVELHPYLQQEKLLSFCQKNQIILTAYAPLGSSDRAPALKRKDEPSLLENPVILEIAKKHQASSAQVLIAWSIARETVVIPKSVNFGRIEENFKSQFVNLDSNDMNEIQALNTNYRYVAGKFFTSKDSPYTQNDLWG